MLAPEPVLKAYLDVLYRIFIYVRMHTDGKDRLPDKQLYDLMDAIHNVPELLTRYGGNMTSDVMREVFFASYDRLWAKNDGEMSLIQVLDDAIARTT